jgi:hypothetical protein
MMYTTNAFVWCFGSVNWESGYRMLPTGVVKGMKGNTTIQTDCLTATEKQLDLSKELVLSLLSLDQNVLKPAEYMFSMTIQLGNMNVACVND